MDYIYLGLLLMYGLTFIKQFNSRYLLFHSFIQLLTDLGLSTWHMMVQEELAWEYGETFGIAIPVLI